MECCRNLSAIFGRHEPKQREFCWFFFLKMLVLLFKNAVSLLAAAVERA
jgi:hypothetical protein